MKGEVKEYQHYLRKKAACCCDAITHKTGSVVSLIMYKDTAMTSAIQQEVYFTHLVTVKTTFHLSFKDIFTPGDKEREPSETKFSIKKHIKELICFM
jgi:hypothetical protein